MYFSRQAHFELNPCVFLAEGRQMPSAFRSAFETQAGPSNKLLPHQPPKKSRTLSAGTSEWSRLLAHSSCRRQTESRGSPEISHVFSVWDAIRMLATVLVARHPTPYSPSPTVCLVLFSTLTCSCGGNLPRHLLLFPAKHKKRYLPKVFNLLHISISIFPRSTFCN